MGDSDIFYWDERGTNFPGATNLGAVGAFCSNLANQLEDAITQYNPTLLILRCGTNDMTASGGATPPAEAANRLIEIVETAFSLTDAPIISFGPKPVRLWLIFLGFLYVLVYNFQLASLLFLMY